MYCFQTLIGSPDKFLTVLLPYGSLVLDPYPKSIAFLNTLSMGDWSIEFEDLSSDSLHAMILRAWAARAHTRTTLTAEVARERGKARASAQRVGELLDLAPLQRTPPATA